MPQTLHLISHTHWDREWYQTFQQFRIRLVHLVDKLLNILDHDPDYRFFMLDGQTIVLEDYLLVRPEREADLRAYIQSGRILIGPWYILPDEFLVSPESTIRNLIEGDRDARRFGPKMEVGYIPDPFGHIGQMPQILQGFNISTACVMRGLSDEPGEFWWEAPDGSRVLMGYLRNGYGNAAGILGGGMDYFVAQAREQRDDLAAHAAAPHHLLMHGTDHQEPDKNTSLAIAYAQEKLDGDSLVHSTLPDYFKAVLASVDQNQLPVVRGELRSSKRTPLLPGVLSARMWIKQRNHACETLLERWASPFSAFAGWAYGGKLPEENLQNPSALLRQAWRLLMQCHPHDSICGCSIDPVHEEMKPRFDQAEQIGEEVTRQSLQALAAAVNTRLPDTLKGFEQEHVSAVTVFNPSTLERTDTTSVVVETPPGLPEFDLLDDTGAKIAYQLEGLSSQDLFNMTMKPEELRSGMGMIADGQIMGLKILEVNVNRKQAEASVEMVLSESEPPAPEVWEQGKMKIEALLADPTVTTFIVRGHTTESSKVIFTAPRVPGMGYRTFWVRAKERVKSPPAALRLNPAARLVLPLAVKAASIPAVRRLIERSQANGSKPPYRIENEFYLVEAQPDGTLDVIDKRTGMFYSGQNRFVDGGDRGDEYNYARPQPDRVVIGQLKGAQVAKNAAQQTLILSIRLDVPAGLENDHKRYRAEMVSLKVTSRVTLSAGVPRIDIHTEVDNPARDHRLRVHFPAPFGVKEAQYDQHFEILTRPTGVPEYDATWVEDPRPEVPQRAFTRISDGKLALLAANRGLPEVEVLTGTDGKSEIAVTLLRCVGWLSRDDYSERKGHAGPGMETPGAQMIGKWEFDYALAPHAETDAAEAIEQGYAFQAPLRAVYASLHEGKLPSSASFFSTNSGEFKLSTAKQAEDGTGWVIRGYNLSDTPVSIQAKVLLPFSGAALANLAEEPISAPLERSGQEVSFEVKGKGIATLRLT